MKNPINVITEYDDGTMDVSCEPNYSGPSILSALAKFKTQRGFAYVIETLHKRASNLEKLQEKHKVYFQKNKKRLYEYRKQYLASNPEQRDKARARARKYTLK